MNLSNICCLILTSVLLWSCSTSAPSADDFQRFVPLTGQHNFRDIGNYATAEGQQLQSCMIYRSGTLANLTPVDVQTIENLGIQTVVSFLTPEEEIDLGVDILPPHITHISLPIVAQDYASPLLQRALRSGDFSDIPIDYNYRIHAELIENGQAAYASLFKLLADEDLYPMVIHCSDGIHRTGTAVALILSALGVPWDEVQTDYLTTDSLSEANSHKKIREVQLLAERNASIRNKDENLANIRAFFTLNHRYIDASQIAILEEYGSFEAYFEKLDLHTSEINELKELLLK